MALPKRKKIKIQTGQTANAPEDRGAQRVHLSGVRRGQAAASCVPQLRVLQGTQSD